MSAGAKPLDLSQRPTWFLLVGGVWAAASIILISHFRFYYDVEWQNALKWGLGDGFLWGLLVGLFVVGLRRWRHNIKSAHHIAGLFILSIFVGILLHPTVSTLFFWAIDGSISRPFHLDVLHMAMKRLPQGILVGVVLGFASFLLVRLERMQAVRTAALEDEPTQRLGPDWIVVKDQRGIRRVAHSDVYYLESAGNYVALHTKEGEELNRTTLKALEQTLEGKRFFRISRKHIVNLDWVLSVQATNARNSVVNLTNNITLPVGRRYKNALQAALEEV